MVYPFLPVLARALGVDIATFSLALSARSATGFLSPFISTVVDIRGRRGGILSAIAVLIAGNALIIFFPVFPVFALGLIINSLGTYLLSPSIQAYLGDHTGYEKRGVAIGIIETGWATSYMLGMPVVAFLIARFGWLSPFQALALLGAALFLLFYIILPGDSRKHSPGTRPDFTRALRAVFKSPLAWSSLGMAFCNGMAKETVNLVFGVWLEDSFGLAITAIGFSAALIGIAEMIGELLGGLMTWRLGKKGTVAAGYGVMVSSAIGLFLFGGTLPRALACYAVMLFAYEIIVVGNFTLMSESLPGARATLIGTYFAFNALGRTISALVTPRIYQVSFNLNLAVLVFFALVAFILLYRMKPVSPSAEAA